MFEKETLQKVSEVEIAPPFSNYHFVNAWERKGGGGGGGGGGGEGGGGEDKGEGEGVEIEVLVAQHRAPREVVERQFLNMYKADFTPALECETWRYVLHLPLQSSSSFSSSSSTGSLLTAEPLPLAASSYGYELPTISPLSIGQKGRFAYVNSLVKEEGFIDGVSKIDLEKGGEMRTHAQTTGRFAGEAVFVPRRGGGGGRRRKR